MQRLATLFVLAAGVVVCQTTQGLISGRVLDSRTARPIPGATIACADDSTNTAATALSDQDGYYFLPLLSPGTYRVRTTSDRYQSQEAQEMELDVAGRLDLSFLLRPLNDVWEAGVYRSVFLQGTKAVVTFYGPDVDDSRSGNFDALRGRRGALETTISAVIDPLELANLLLSGRDVYSLLFTLPAVTSDGGISRGLGLSVNGQRPSSSNYLLDGVENNNYLITGPLTPIAPEAIQEYRVSISNFSAQYGRTSGFVANAVTKAGASDWHGVGYFYMRNEALDANTFQRNLSGLGRQKQREFQPGFQAGGPILRDRLFFSSAFEYFQGRSLDDPQTVYFPSPTLVAALPPASVAAMLLSKYPAPVPAVAAGPCALAQPAGCVVKTTLAPPISINRSLGLARFDYITPGGAQHLTSRVSVAKLERPDFLWSPYSQFTSPFEQTSIGVVLSHEYAIRPGLTNEARFGYSIDEIGYNHDDPGLATLRVRVGLPTGTVQLALPGSSPVYPFQNNNHTSELLDNLVWAHGRHVMTVGVGALLRNIDGFFAPQRDGLYQFNTLTRFANGTPDVLFASIDRQDLAHPATPDFNRTYRNRQYFAFAQDAFRATLRLALNFGLRYEAYGAPHSVGKQRDAVLELGPGSDLLARLQSATLNLAGGPAGSLYSADNRDWGVRAGFSYDVWGSGRTALRGAYGIFYDRPFDNLWQTMRTNNLDFAQITFSGAAVDFSQPVAQALPGLGAQFRTLKTSVPNLTLFQPNLRNGYAQNMFIGVQQRVNESLTLEVDGLGSLGRQLLTNDTLGFNVLLNGSQPGIPAGQLITYRANQGLSDYYSLVAQARYRRGGRLFQASYTLSHAIDNQSDALGLDLSDFGFSDPRVLPAVPAHLVAGFATPMDSRGDRGNSDFDERHNLILLSAFGLPHPRRQGPLGFLARDWTVSEVAAFRSGFPYTVYSLGGIKGFARASVVNPALESAHAQPVTGGELLLNASGFGAPGVGQPSGRNALIGPGFYNLDVSVSRSFPLRGLRESARLSFRADLYNAMNHANLNNPSPILGSGFGVAAFGRTGRAAGFPTPLPLGETPRQVQLSVRLRF